MSPILCAFIASLLQAFNTVIFRHSMKDNGDVWGAALLFYVIALVAMLLYFPLPELSIISAQNLVLLLASGACWVAIFYWDLKAYQYLEACNCEVIGTISVVTLCLVSFFVFNEKISLFHASGITIIIGTIVYTSRSKTFPINRGLMFKLLSVAGVTLVYSIDKHLVTEVSREAIFYFGFGTPAVLLFITKWRSLAGAGEIIRKSNYAFLLSPICSLCRVQFLIVALTYGELGITYTIIKAGIIFVLIFEIFLLRIREGLPQKALACMGCLTGAVILGI